MTGFTTQRVAKKNSTEVALNMGENQLLGYVALRKNEVKMTPEEAEYWSAFLLLLIIYMTTTYPMILDFSKCDIQIIWIFTSIWYALSLQLMLVSYIFRHYKMSLLGLYSILLSVLVKWFSPGVSDMKNKYGERVSFGTAVVQRIYSFVYHVKYVIFNGFQDLVIFFVVYSVFVFSLYGIARIFTNPGQVPAQPERWPAKKIKTEPKKELAKIETI